MSQALQRIDETREALIGALAERNWEAVGELDLGCRAVIDQVLSEAPVDEDALREKLESLLAVYQQLLEVTTGERQAISKRCRRSTERKVRQRFTICSAEWAQLIRTVRHIFDCASIFDLTSAVFRFQTSSKVRNLTNV